MRHSENTVLEGIVSLDEHSYDLLSTSELSFPGSYSSPLLLEIKPINHNFSLQFSIRKTGDDEDENISTAPNTILEEHLTLGYF